MGLQCSACGSERVRAERTRSAFWHDERLVVVDNIPALVCEQCGELFYDDRVAIGLDLMRGDGFPREAAARTIEVPVFDYDERPSLQGGA